MPAGTGGTEVAKAYVSIFANTAGLGRDVVTAMDGTVRTGQSAGAKIGSSITRGLGTIVKGVVGVGAVVAGLAGAGGIQRALAIEGAQKKLEGLGHSADSVTGVMNDALASVKGTAFGLGDAASVAATLVAAGVKQGGQLEGVLKTVADTAAISGRTMGDIGLIFSSVAARGKLQGDDMLQLMSSGVPVLQLLATQTGKTSAEVSKMVSDGKIDFATFAAAMQAGMGGAALKSGETFTGALANVRAALSRLGAVFATPVLDALRLAFTAAIPVIDKLTAKIQPLADRFGKRLVPAVQGLIDLLGHGNFSSELRDAFGWEEDSGAVSFLLGVRDAATRAGEVVGRVGPTVQLWLSNLGSNLQQVWTQVVQPVLAELPGLLDAVLPSLTPLMESFGNLASKVFPIVGEAVRTVLPPLIKLAEKVLPPLLNAVTKIIDFVADHSETIAGITASIGTFVLVSRGLDKTISTVIGLKKAFDGLKTAGSLASLLSGLVGGGVVVWVIAAVVALAVALVYAWNHSEKFREVVTKVWTAVKTAVQRVVDWVTGTAVPAVKDAWDKVSGFFSDLRTKVSDVVDAVRTKISDWVEAIKKFGSDTRETFDSVKTKVTDTFEAVKTKVGEVVDRIVGFVDQALAPVRAIIETIRTYVAAVLLTFGAIFSGNFEDIGKIWAAFGTRVKQIWSDLWENVKTKVGEVWESIKTRVGEAFESVKTTITSKFTEIVDWVRGVPQRASDALSSIGTTLATNLRGWLSDVVTAVSEKFSEAVEWIRGVPGRAWSALSSIGSTLASGMRTWLSEMVTAARGKLDEMVDWIRGVPQRARDALSDIASTLRQSGRALIQGLIDGIGDKIDAVKEKVHEVMNSARRQLPFSPAKEGPFSGRGWTLYSGRSIVDALATGVTQRRGRFVSAVSGVLSAGSAQIGTLGTARFASAGSAPGAGGVQQVFNTTVIRAEDDLYTAAPIIHRSAARALRLAGAPASSGVA